MSEESEKREPVATKEAAPESKTVEEQSAAEGKEEEQPKKPQDLMSRPARRQSTTVREFTPVMSGDYNIWYHRYIGYEYHESRKDRGVLTRCSIARDAGRTRADASAPICIHFAMGDCVRGHECQVCVWLQPSLFFYPNPSMFIAFIFSSSSPPPQQQQQYRHCLPTDADERRVGVTHDVFGRERHKTDRDDMGGVGSFSRENRTLFVRGLNAETSVADYERVVRAHFGEWGDLEYVRAFPARGFAFVRYRLRTAAEFAKIAMAEQALDHGETLNVRWARDDPNPIARAHEEQAATARFLSAVQHAIDDNAADADAAAAAPPAAKRPAPTVDAPRAAPRVQYRYVFVGQGGRDCAPGAPAAPAPESALAEKGDAGTFAANPFTHELHPYAQGVYHLNQIREAPRDTSAVAQRARTQQIARCFGSSDNSAPAPRAAPLPALAQMPPPPPPPPAAVISSEPGFFNDEPLV